MGKLTKADGATPYLRLKARIESLRSDKRFSFMFAGLTIHDVMANVLARFIRIPVDGKPITIIDLSGVPSEIVDRSEEHTSELQSLMRISYAVFCLKKKNQLTHERNH